MAQQADIVAILRQDTSVQVLADARPLRASIYERSRVADHPLEDGSVVSDHIVKEPTEIDMPVMVLRREAFEELRQLYEDGTLLIVQTRMAAYGSMVLTEIPHEETAEAFDVTPVGLRLRRFDFVATVYTGLAPAKVKDKAKASTVKKGAQQTTKASAAQEAKAKPSLLKQGADALLGG